MAVVFCNILRSCLDRVHRLTMGMGTGSSPSLYPDSEETGNLTILDGRDTMSTQLNLRDTLEGFINFSIYWECAGCHEAWTDLTISKHKGSCPKCGCENLKQVNRAQYELCNMR